MSAFRTVAACAAMAISSAPAFADDVERTLVVTWAEAEGDAEAHIAANLPNWLVAAAPRGTTVRWDEKECGPFDLVDRRARIVIRERDGAKARVTVTIEDSDLPSGQAAVSSYAARVAAGFRIVAEESLSARAAERSASLAPRIVRFEARAAELRATTLRAEGAAGGDAAELLAAAQDRLRVVAAELAAARTHRASVSRRLEFARRAAKLAAQLERDRRDAGRLAETNDLGEKEKALLAELEARIDAIAASCPSLDAAREQVFALELDLLDQEARNETLAAEAAALRAEVARLRPLAASLEAARAELVSVESDLRSIRREREAVAARYERPSLDITVLTPR
ncbi:MAG: hypothetical protein HMLKMBBP_03432 [Planctomycetes bacterium]|nr:hypothetical protein [Planctomycetota bacterium]